MSDLSRQLSQPDLRTEVQRPVRDDTTAKAIEAGTALALDTDKRIQVDTLRGQLETFRSQTEHDMVAAYGKEADVSQFSDDMKTLAAGSEQQFGMSQMNYRLRAETQLREAINKRPGLRRELTQAAVDALGFNPSNEFMRGLEGLIDAASTNQASAQKAREKEISHFAGIASKWNMPAVLPMLYSNDPFMVEQGKKLLIAESESRYTYEHRNLAATYAKNNSDMTKNTRRSTFNKGVSGRINTEVDRIMTLAAGDYTTLSPAMIEESRLETMAMVSQSRADLGLEGDDNQLGDILNRIEDSYEILSKLASGKMDKEQAENALNTLKAVGAYAVATDGSVPKQLLGILALSESVGTSGSVNMKLLENKAALKLTDVYEDYEARASNPKSVATKYVENPAARGNIITNAGTARDVYSDLRSRIQSYNGSTTNDPDAAYLIAGDIRRTVTLPLRDLDLMPNANAAISVEQVRALASLDWRKLGSDYSKGFQVLTTEAETGLRKFGVELGRLHMSQVTAGDTRAELVTYAPDPVNKQLFKPVNESREARQVADELNRASASREYFTAMENMGIKFEGMLDSSTSYIFKDAVRRNNIDFNLAAALIKTESGDKGQAAKSESGAVGFTQLIPETADDLGVDETDPAQNIHGGMRYLRQMIDRYAEYGEEAATILGLAAYHAGPGNMDAKIREVKGLGKGEKHGFKQRSMQYAEKVYENMGEDLNFEQFLQDTVGS